MDDGAVAVSYLTPEPVRTALNGAAESQFMASIRGRRGDSHRGPPHQGDDNRVLNEDLAAIRHSMSKEESAANAECSVGGIREAEGMAE
jgi:hypothetical protein